MKPIPLTGANSAFQIWAKELGQNDKVFAMKKQYLSMYLSRLTNLICLGGTQVRV